MMDPLNVPKLEAGCHPVPGCRAPNCRETNTGFEGALAMRNLTSPIRIEKNTEKSQEGQPDCRIFAGETATEIGGGWMGKAKPSGRQYLFLTLSDPQTGRRKIYANLAPVRGKKGRHVIFWNPKD